MSGRDGVGEQTEQDLFGSYINFLLIAVQNPTDHVSGEIEKATGYSYHGELWLGLCGRKNQ